MHENIVISEFRKHKYISRATGTLLKLTVQQNSYNQIFNCPKDQNNSIELYKAIAVLKLRHLASIAVIEA